MSHQYNYYVRLADQCQHLRQVSEQQRRSWARSLTVECKELLNGASGDANTPPPQSSSSNHVQPNPPMPKEQSPGPNGKSAAPSQVPEAPAPAPDKEQEIASARPPAEEKPARGDAKEADLLSMLDSDQPAEADKPSNDGGARRLSQEGSYGESKQQGTADLLGEATSATPQSTDLLGDLLSAPQASLSP
eukprot:628650-Hanusia_phi.AAC.3